MGYTWSCNNKAGILFSVFAEGLNKDNRKRVTHLKIKVEEVFLLALGIH